MNYLNGQKHSFEDLNNRAFLFGDSVSVYFFVKNRRLFLEEESYFFLMASMRKMYLNIPLSFTLDFFVETFRQAILETQVSDAIIHVMVFREDAPSPSSRTSVGYSFQINPTKHLLKISKNVKIDLLKEIYLSTHFLSNILVHCPENIYAEMYSKEHSLDEIMFLNHQKRIARSLFGNLLFLDKEIIKTPKRSEGAYISPLTNGFLDYIHKNQLFEIQEVEMQAFESQKADEILIVSDQKGFYSVSEIRNKRFQDDQFNHMLQKWEASLG